MKVKELIKELQIFNQEAEVKLYKVHQTFGMIIPYDIADIQISMTKENTMQVNIGLKDD
jgi:hypothetical protein